MGCEVSRTRVYEPIAESPKKVEKWVPHNFDAIVEEADVVTSKDELLENIHSGFFLGQKGKKYWVDKKSGCNCFLIFARQLSITWSDDPQHWQWSYLNDSDGDIEAANLVNVCWLEVHGTCSTALLTPGTMYEVAFLVMIKDPAYGWEVPVVVCCTDPVGNVQTHKENLLDKPRERWIELIAGTFMATAGGGIVQYSLFEYEGGQWKRGLIIKCAVIRPKN